MTLKIAEFQGITILEIRKVLFKLLFEPKLDTE